MGTSTNGQICFGIPFEEDYEYPWDDEKYDGGFDDWWIYEICNYKNPFELYNEEGYVGGKRPPEEKISEYFDTKNKFANKHPSPVGLVNYCSSDCDMYIVAIPKTCISNSRGYPEIFEPEKMVVSDKDRNELIIFCEKYCRPKDDESWEFPKMEPKWYLSSYWG